MTWDEFCNGVKKAAGKAADKINQTADLATLQVKLTMAEHKLDDAYAELGRAAYRHFTDENSSAELVSVMMKGVAEAQKAVDDLKAQIEALKEDTEKAKNEETTIE
ncbi:MAG: hypothetical protein IJZ80_06740 [Clostridia bacterium]|nr:hypothetical protein [Clostridia bacterium]